MSKTQILIADDHPVFLFGLKAIIGSIKSCEVTDVASNGRDAFNLISKTNPHIAVLDIDMPGLNGIEVLKKVTAMNSSTKIIILTMHKDESIFNLAFDYGAVGYVIKDNAAIDIVNCIHVVSEGDLFVSPQINSYKIKRKSSNNSNELTLINSLTVSEKVVLKEVCENKSSTEIANKLNVSHKTIQNHRFNICKKMNLEGVNSLLTYALLNKSTINLILTD
jgi:DNA-binding NarL/FixJ family response regulator